VYETYAVSTDSSLCAPVGRNILALNGSAADAAIAMLLCMGVTTPHLTGLSGGCLILYYNSSDKQMFGIDAREEAPKESRKDILTDNEERKAGLSVAIPGQLSGYRELHDRFGRLEWTKLFDSAIQLSRDGFRVNNDLENAFIYVNKHLPKSSTLRKHYINPKTNEHYKRGDIIKNIQLSQTLTQLANSLDPIQLFYMGSVAKDIVQDIEEYAQQNNYTRE
ncbi:unnamed protein product, partial [Medioppia subpectinata]